MAFRIIYDIISSMASHIFAVDKTTPGFICRFRKIKAMPSDAALRAHAHLYFGIDARTSEDFAARFLS